jgi:AcrR family transcriptional regulator
MGKTKREVVTEYRTGELLAAARTVFAEKGFDGATIEDVAAAAGVAKGTVYIYYRSKRELYGAVFREGMLALHRATTERVQAAPNLQAKIRAFVTTKLAYFDEHRDFFRLYFEAFGSARAVGPGLQAEFDALYREQVRLLEAAIRSGAKRGECRKLRPDAAAFAIFDLTRGLLRQRTLGWSSAGLEADVAFAFEFIWKGIAG